MAVEYKPEKPSEVTVAPYDATYRLTISEPHSTCVISTVELKKGERVGYQLVQVGQPVAIAGERVIPIPDRWSEWRYTHIPQNSFERCLVTARNLSEDFAQQAVGILLLPIALPAWYYVTHHPPTSDP
jgi:hypothetical protein